VALVSTRLSVTWLVLKPLVDMSPAGPCILFDGHCIPIVECYKHVGRLITDNGSMAPEVKTKAAIGWQTCSRNHCLFTSSSIPPDVRASFAGALVWSRIYNQAGSWPPLTPSQSATLEAPRVKVLSHISDQVSYGALPVWPDSQVIAKNRQLPDIAFRLRLRLLFLPRVLIQAPRALRSLLAYGWVQCGWVSMIMDEPVILLGKHTYICIFIYSYI
jgi:hypothetical protein